MRKKDRNNQLLCLLFVIIVAIRFLGLSKGIWTDEGSTIRVIFSQDFINQLRTYDHPPLYFILLKFWSKINSEEYFLRCLSVIFSVLTVFVTIKWIKYYSIKAALITGLIIGTLPILLRYSHEIRHYSLLLLSTASSFYFACQIVCYPKKWIMYFGLGISLIISILTHLIGIFILPAIFLYILIESNHEKWERIKKLVVLFFVSSLIFGYIYFVFLTEINQKSEWWISTPKLVETIRIVKHIFGLTASIDLNHLTVEMILTPLIIILILFFSGLLLINMKQKRYVSILAAALIFIGQLYLYSFLKTPIVSYRTLLPAIVPIAAYIGLQTDNIANGLRRKIVIFILLVICFLFSLNWVLSAAWKPYEKWKEMAELLKSSWAEDDFVVCYPHYTVDPIQFYFRNLPQEKMISIHLRTGMETVAEQLNQVNGNMFLVFRYDASIESDNNTYNYIIDELHSRDFVSVYSKLWGDLHLTKFISQ